MRTPWIACCILAGALAGCAAPVQTALAPQNVWLDPEFGFQPDWVSVSSADLFALDPVLVAELRSHKLQRASTEARIDFIVRALVDNAQQPFKYASGHSTVAAQTWRQRSGDCLSLTVLAYAMAKELNLMATMQEIQGSLLFDRRGASDYRVGHVNLFVERSMVNDMPLSTSFARGTVIDFEPTYGTRRHGTALSRQGILARYYNNLGAEFWAQKDLKRAYAHFKAALHADPEFSGAAANLAGLYWQAGYTQAAEAVLMQAVASTQYPGVAALRALHRLLTLQGRDHEAQKYQRVVERLQEQEPYYWIDQGVAQLRDREYRRAVASLERAQSLSSGFSEVHRNLALAYVLAGKPAKAQEQLTLLASVDSEDPGLPVIKRKINLALARPPAAW